MTGAARAGPQRWLTDNTRHGSLVNLLRRRQFEFFRALLDSLPRPISILDVGGTQSYWINMGISDPMSQGLSITTVNLQSEPAARAGFRSVRGDALKMPMFGNGEFDVAFSHSVIEHVGGIADQKRMAGEIRRIGKRYILQTPNRNFPIEVHFQFPYFLQLPIEAQVWLLRHFSLGWYSRVPERDRALEVARSINALDEAAVRILFPGASIKYERVLGFKKSLIALYGW
jgi:SAM-dependent methyltransferase